jgi:hypothetical protein
MNFVRLKITLVERDFESGLALLPFALRDAEGRAGGMRGKCITRSSREMDATDPPAEKPLSSRKYYC